MSERFPWAVYASIEAIEAIDCSKYPALNSAWTRALGFMLVTLREIRRRGQPDCRQNRQKRLKFLNMGGFAISDSVTTGSRIT